VNTIHPDVLPAGIAELIPKTQAISRREFSQQHKRSLRLVIRDESLAIDYIPDYCTSILVYGDDNRPQITGKGHLLKRKLTPYHIWILKRALILALCLSLFERACPHDLANGQAVRD
jgi:hypothetical protein